MTKYLLAWHASTVNLAATVLITGCVRNFCLSALSIVWVIMGTAVCLSAADLVFVLGSKCSFRPGCL